MALSNSSQFAIGIAAVVERICGTRVQSNRLVVVLQRTLEIADATIRDAAIDEGAVICRIQKND